jgi:hypothetical protein
LICGGFFLHHLRAKNCRKNQNFLKISLIEFKIASSATPTSAKTAAHIK